MALLPTATVLLLLWLLKLLSNQQHLFAPLASSYAAVPSAAAPG